eukprot:CAMPEP_0202732594 /NCGR_PEP_ID=MMETSP1385-20130828/187739_1 /ASSEMBLY_ACC=CAM_ASM_000861 /TAXON_ID=933848 /ORGANISM="Elphidium margaritaceum" /LENGTH=292 /DNA_ID=CAMNT_0049398913 /DNA_START=766 /DNA_END=1644 /DNA_ORIENTATION=-
MTHHRAMSFYVLLLLSILPTNGHDCKKNCNCYKVLGLANDADPSAVTWQFRKLSLKYHPDKNPAGKSQFTAINEAHTVLKDKQERANYHKECKPSPPQVRTSTQKRTTTTTTRTKPVATTLKNLSAKLGIVNKVMVLKVGSLPPQQMKAGDRLIITTKSRGQEKKETFEYEELCRGGEYGNKCFVDASNGKVKLVAKMNAKLKAPVALKWERERGDLVGSWIRTSGAHDAYVNAYDYGYEYAGDEEGEYDQQVEGESAGLEEELDDMLNDMFMAGYQKGLSVAQQRRYRYNY